MQNLTIAISTKDQRASEINLPNRHPSINYIIIHQCKTDDSSFEEKFHREDVTYIRSFEIGISKSRNLAIKSSSTEYTLIMDDDTEINLENCLDALKIAEKIHADVLTCQFTFQEKSRNKNYKTDVFNHNYLSAAKVSSIEIILKTKSIINNEIFFDENFGLGTIHPSGEEYIFITDCIKNGLKAAYAPICLCIHPNISSGHDFYTEKNKIIAKKQMFKRIFGRYHIFLTFLFWAKKLPIVLRNGNIYFFTKHFLF